MTTTTLRPGILVSLKTTVTGNVKYRKLSDSEEARDDGARVAKLETERTTLDAAEQEAAVKVRSKVRSLMGSVCKATNFGLLCPKIDADKLSAVMTEARALAAAFNSTANVTRVGVYIIRGEIAETDAEAVRAISSEVRELMDQMKEGISNMDAKVIRDAANRARSVGTMLSPDAAARIQIAIDAARATAKAIVKAGESVGQEVDKQAIQRITEQQVAFLDLDDAPEMDAPQVEATGLEMVA